MRILCQLKAIMFYLMDLVVPKNKNYWMFPCHYIQTDTFKDNPRAVFEHIKQSSEIKKIIVFRGDDFKNNIDSAVNIEIVRHGTLKFFILLSRAAVVFLANSISLDYSFRFKDAGFSILRISGKRRLIINLWHGIPLKGLSHTANPAVAKWTDRVKYRIMERRTYGGLIASSEVDGHAMAASFYPLNFRQIWITGLPRNDFLLQNESDLPKYQRETIEKLKKIKKDHRLVVYAPTYRQVNATNIAKYYQFSESEIGALKNLLEKHNAILGYRPHYFKNTDAYFNIDNYIDNRLIFDLSVKVIDDFAPVARLLDFLITDYSSVYMDCVYLDKSVIGFVYDLDSYLKQQNGLLYPYSLAFPGPACKSFDALLKELEKALNCPEHDYKHVKRMFYSNVDCDNCKRVVEMIKTLQ